MATFSQVSVTWAGCISQVSDTGLSLLLLLLHFNVQSCPAILAVNFGQIYSLPGLTQSSPKWGLTPTWVKSGFIYSSRACV